MRRTFIVIGIIVLLMLPVVFFMVQRRATSGETVTAWPLTKPSPIPDRYSAISEAPGYTIKLVDTRYLDYVAENIGIFKSEAVVDPQVYRGGTMFRHTVSRTRLVLLPIVSQLLVAIPGRNKLASTADYIVESDTLVLRVTVDPTEVVSVAAGQHTLEDAFLRAAMQTMYYAHGLSDDSLVNAAAFAKIQSSIKEYLYIGILPWPIRIERMQ